MKELFLVIAAIASIYFIFDSLSRVNKNKELKGSTKSAFIYLIYLIPILGFILSRKLNKED